jgi:ABC-2 type transport system permease protein
MIGLLQAEWLRFIRNPVNLWVIAAFFTLLVSSALWSGLAADEFRAKAFCGGEFIRATAIDANTQQGIVTEMHDAAGIGKAGGASKLADSATVCLPALGGLALSVRQMDLFGSELHISSRSRYTDGRNSDQLFNPLLRELGLLDFAGVLALLLPLTVIALTYGLVQEDRERGVWRLVCAQMPEPWQLVFAALAVRLAAVLIPVVSASLLAFMLDSGSTLYATVHWLVFVCVFTGVWIAVCGLFLLLPVSSGAAAVGLLGVWLITTFAVPAGLSWAANTMEPMPSRLEAIVDIRRIQAQTSKQQGELLVAWYQSHPEIVPVKEPSREIAGLPANLELDSKVRPLMYRFDEVRKAHFEFMERWSALSPGLSSVLTADRLAGIDAPRYAGYIDAANQFEDRWRAFFVPKIIAKQTMLPTDYEYLPEAKPLPAFEAVSTVMAGQSLTGIVLLLALIMLRSRFGRP